MASINSLVPHKMQSVQPRSDYHMFTSDENALLKQIISTHTPDSREIDVKPLLKIVEDIMGRVTHTTPGMGHGMQTQTLETLEEKAHHMELNNMLEILAYTINRISCEILCKCSGGGDVHSTTVATFNVLSSYSWEAKVVLALAAFSVTYGEFWIVAQLYRTDPLAKSVALLKQLPDALERPDSLKPKFEAVNSLIRSMLDVTNSIVDLNRLPSRYLPVDTPEFLTAAALIPMATYWTIRSIVACASQIVGLIGMGHEYMTMATETWELSSLAHKLNNIHNHLVKQLELLRHIIHEKQSYEAYQILKRLFETPHSDNSKILTALIGYKGDQFPLHEGSTNRKTNTDELRRKNVLLFISDLDLLPEELAVLVQMYIDSRQHSTRLENQYEVVWLPIIDRSDPWNEAKEKRFQTHQSYMPWYSISHPSFIDQVVNRYVRDEWNFKKKPLIVVLDPQGKVVHKNALPMMWIWGSLAFPFTMSREAGLWKDETWRIELLADAIDQMVLDWIADGKHICLYGGEDIVWIRKFTTRAQVVAQAANIKLEMLYVGKSNPREKIRQINDIIAAEKLSHTLQHLNTIWYFWVRLESMWNSKALHGQTANNDQITQEIVTMLSFDAGDQGWAVISRGSTEMTRAKGDQILKCFDEFDAWKEHAVQKGFVPALDEHLHLLHTPHHCNRLILPGITGIIPETVVCAECGRPMEKFIMYRCCTD